MSDKTQKIKKREINMLEGSLWDKILIYAFPLAATGILQQLFNAADIAVVGRFTGSMASLCMAAVGANTPIVGLIVNLFVGISMKRFLCELFIKTDLDALRELMRRAEAITGSPKEAGKAFRALSQAKTK